MLNISCDNLSFSRDCEIWLAHKANVFLLAECPPSSLRSHSFETVSIKKPLFPQVKKMKNVRLTGGRTETSEPEMLHCIYRPSGEFFVFSSCRESIGLLQGAAVLKFKMWDAGLECFNSLLSYTKMWKCVKFYILLQRVSITAKIIRFKMSIEIK